MSYRIRPNKHTMLISFTKNILPFCNFLNSGDPDQLASEEATADQDLHESKIMNLTGNLNFILCMHVHRS